jgi:hypothetical protein
MSKITKSIASAEIARRQLPKSDPQRVALRPAYEVLSLSTADLKAIVAPAAKVTPANVTPITSAPKKLTPAERKVAVAKVAAQAGRKLAWDFRASEFKAGRKVTYVAACAKFNTTPAKA